MPIKIGQVYPSLPVIPFVSICVWINICGEGLCSTIPKGQFFSRSLTYIWPNFHISPTLHSWRSRHAFSLLSRPLEPRLLNRNMLCNMFFEAMKDGWCIQGVKKKKHLYSHNISKTMSKTNMGSPKDELSVGYIRWNPTTNSRGPRSSWVSSWYLHEVNWSLKNHP